jgi:alkylhydroperoxidase family enzyme
VFDVGADAGPGPAPARVSLLRTAQADPLAREVFARSYGQYGGIANLYRALASSPELLRAWADLAWPLRQRLEVPRALCEAAILRVARALQAPYVWAHHWEFAEAAGVSADQLAWLAAGEPWTVFTGPLGCAVRAADEMTAAACVSDECFAALSEQLPAGQVVELLTTIAFYHGVARLTRALRLPLEDGPSWPPLPEVAPEAPAADPSTGSGP